MHTHKFIVLARHHRRCRSALDRAVPHRKPTERRPLRCARRPEGAHTEAIDVTDAVFHAPMFTLKADAAANACEPTMPRRRGVYKSAVWIRVRPNTRTSALAHARDIGTDLDICIFVMRTNTIDVSVISQKCV